MPNTLTPQQVNQFSEALNAAFGAIGGDALAQLAYYAVQKRLADQSRPCCDARLAHSNLRDDREVIRGIPPLDGSSHDLRCQYLN